MSRYFTDKPCKHGHIAERQTKDGHCVDCVYVKNKEQYKKHTIKRRAYAKQYREQNPDIINVWKLENPQYQTEWARKNKAKRRRIEQRMLANNMQRKLAHALRRRLNSIIKRNKRPGSAIKNLGCSLEQLKLHIENQFTEAMEWSNWGPAWQLDHIKPLMDFDLSDPVQFHKACHFSNLQPLSIEHHKTKTVSEINKRNKQEKEY